MKEKEGNKDRGKDKTVYDYNMQAIAGFNRYYIEKIESPTCYCGAEKAKGKAFFCEKCMQELPEYLLKRTPPIYEKDGDVFAISMSTAWWYDSAVQWLGGVY